MGGSTARAEPRVFVSQNMRRVARELGENLSEDELQVRARHYPHRGLRSKRTTATLRRRLLTSSTATRTVRSTRRNSWCVRIAAPSHVRARAHTVRTLPSRVSLHTEQYIMKQSSICE